MDFVDVGILDVGGGGALAYVTLASDGPPCPCPKGGQLEVQKTLRVGFGGSTGRGSRERSGVGFGAACEGLSV